MKKEFSAETAGGKTRAELSEENAQLRGDLLSIATRINHDLRAPLGAIVSTAELLQEILLEKNPEATTLATSLFEQVDEMTKLLGQVRVLTKATALPAPKERLKMETIVLKALQGMESRMIKMQATVVQPRSWPEAYGVAEWLEFIWSSLLANSLDYAGKNAQVELGWQKKNNEFYFQVCNQGSALPVESVTALLKPFDLLHQPGGAKGLGLSVVQRLVQLQGGSCGYTTPNDRSCFYFTLPMIEV